MINTFINMFFGGATMTACGVAGFFFLRYWRLTGDRFFVIFSLAFWILAAERVALAFMHVQGERVPLMYVIRLTAYICIVAAIIEKNRAEGNSPDG